MRLIAEGEFGFLLCCRCGKAKKCFISFFRLRQGKARKKAAKRNHVKFICQASNFFFPLSFVTKFSFLSLARLGNLTERKHVKKWMRVRGTGNVQFGNQHKFTFMQIEK
jgi:hypothetical protein